MIFGANTLFFGTILFFFIFADNVFVNGKRSDKFAMYGMKPHSRVRDFFSKCFGGGLKVKEWPRKSISDKIQPFQLISLLR